MRRYMRKHRHQRSGDEQNCAGPAQSTTIAQVAEEWIADCRADKNGAQGHASLFEVEPPRILHEQRPEAAYAAAGEIAQPETEAGQNEQQPKPGSGEQFSVGHVFFGQSRRFLFGEPDKQTRHQEAQEAQFQNRSAPAGRGGPPSGIERADEKSDAGANAAQSERPPGSDGEEARDHRRRCRMIETAAETRRRDAEECPPVIGREGESHESEGVDGQPGREQFLAIEPVGEHAHGITGREIGEHHNREEQSGLFDSSQLQIALNRQVERHQCHVINMGERVQRGAKPKRACFMVLCHSHFFTSRAASKNSFFMKTIQRLISEHPRGSACAARPINSNPSPRRTPRSSV